MTPVDDLVAWLTKVWDEQEDAAKQASPGPWHLNAEHDEVLAADDIEVCTAFALSNNQLRWTARHIAANDPAAVLAQIGAHKEILALHHPDRVLENWYWLERKCAECGHGWHSWIPDSPPTVIGPERGCPTVRLLAQPYADRPGFQQAWRVS